MVPNLLTYQSKVSSCDITYVQLMNQVLSCSLLQQCALIQPEKWIDEHRDLLKPIVIP